MTKRRTSAKLDSSKVPSTKPLIEISEEEQWRLIHDTGILHKVSDVTNSEAAATDTQGREALDLGDEIFNATLLIIPFSFLLLLMEM